MGTEWREPLSPGDNGRNEKGKFTEGQAEFWEEKLSELYGIAQNTVSEYCMTKKQKRIIEKAVKKMIKEYSETIRLLASS